jgi:hypothetical protein
LPTTRTAHAPRQPQALLENPYYSDNKGRHHPALQPLGLTKPIFQALIGGIAPPRRAV